MRKLLLLVPIVFCFVFFSCKMDVNLSDEIQLNWEGSDCWMSSVSDSTLLRDLTVPGTHDSCANYDFFNLSSSAGAQDLTLAQQLESGVRYLDIRPCLENGQLVIRHGITKQHILFSSVLSTIDSFLDKNNSETVIMAIWPEFTDFEDYSNVYNYIKGLDSSEFVMGKDASALTMGECRGKTIIINRLPVLSSMLDVFCTGYTETGAVGCTSDLEDQWNRIVKALETTGSTSLRAVYSAGYYEGQFGIPNIRIASSAINPKLKAYLDGQKSPKSFGIIVADHITKNLAHSIFILNK